MVAVLHVDAAVLAVDKPAGRLVIPGRVAGEPCLRAELTALHGPLWVVHRLDRGTSGVLLFARSAAAHRALNLAFERGEAEKTYLALVAGLPAEDDWRCVVPLAPGRKGKVRPAHPGEPAGKAAATAFRVVRRFQARAGQPAAALLEARPETGRTHQIRVHLRCAGHPLLVDPDYGEAAPLCDPAGAAVLTRTPLHAARLSLPHPDGGALTLLAEPPADLAAALALLGSEPG